MLDNLLVVEFTGLHVERNQRTVLTRKYEANYGLDGIYGSETYFLDSIYYAF